MLATKQFYLVVYTGILCLLMNLSLIRRIPSKAQEDGRVIKEYKRSFQTLKLEDKKLISTPPPPPIITPTVETVDPPCEIDFRYNNNYNNGISKTQWDYMLKNRLCLSFKHQNEFVMRKDKLISFINLRPNMKHLIYGPIGIIRFAVIINDQYAFRHIFKNGGTTVNKVMQSSHVGFEEVGNRTLFATVRDPIDHFLSGWAECGFRSTNPDDPAFAMDVEHNQRIQNWLKCVKGGTSGGQDDSSCPCSKHSYPQTNFLLEPHNAASIDPQIGLVGDLREIVELFKMVGFTYDGGKWPTARVASRNLEKTEKFPSDLALLSDETIRLICEFVILDYYLFAFEPPEVCRDQIEADIVKIDKISLSVDSKKKQRKQQ